MCANLYDVDFSDNSNTYSYRLFWIEVIAKNVSKGYKYWKKTFVNTLSTRLGIKCLHNEMGVL